MATMSWFEQNISLFMWDHINLCIFSLGGMYGMPPPLMERYGLGLPMGHGPLVSFKIDFKCHTRTSWSCLYICVAGKIYSLCRLIICTWLENILLHLCSFYFCIFSRNKNYEALICSISAASNVVILVNWASVSFVLFLWIPVLVTVQGWKFFQGVRPGAFPEESSQKKIAGV